MTTPEWKDSWRGKLWSSAVQEAFHAPFPEVAIQHLLRKVHQAAQIEMLEAILNYKHEAHNEREAIIPPLTGVAVAGTMENEPPLTDSSIRQLQYVKVYDILMLLNELKEERI